MLKRYKDYKDSRVDWIGGVPAHWCVKKLSLIFNFTTGFTPSTSNSEFYDDGDVDWVTISDMKGKFISCSESKITSKATEGKQIVPKGALMYSFKLSVGKVAFAQKDIYTNEAIFSIFPEDGLCLEYYYYLLPHVLIFNANENIYGAKILNQEIIKSSKLVVPPYEEQVQIAAYLELQTVKIDKLISDKVKLIDLLNEERTAIIYHAVTKGVAPDVPMKDSGVDWLGEVPQNWTVKKVKHVFNCLNTQRIPLNGEERGAMTIKKYDYYGASGVIDKVDNFLFEEPLILIGEDGANLLTRSKRLAFIASGQYWVNNHAHILKPRNGNINYLCELLELIDYSIYVSGSAQPKLTQEALLSITIAEPPPTEQTEIYKHIKHQTGKIDEIILKTTKEIGLLKEYKTALISEVVTGKIDVRNEVLTDLTAIAS